VPRLRFENRHGNDQHHEGIRRVEETDQELVGTIGHVTVPIVPDRPGEVMLPVRGGAEAYAAFSDEPIAKFSRVVVVEVRSPRSVDVTPCA
jgi:hypothetical protein